jgi:hypothetical protein
VANKQTSPILSLPPTATLDDHLDLLGLLNSSTLGFWMKQVFHDKGGGGIGGGLATEDWEHFWEYDSTKLQQAPITTRNRAPRVALATALDATATERAACLPAALLAAGTWSPSSGGADLAAAHDRYLALTSRMVALQEELDWLTYGSYALIEPVPTVAPGAIEPLAPGHRPFEIALARRDDEADDDEKSAWWSRHGHDRVAEMPEHYSTAHRNRLQQRIELIESDPRLALLETPPYKRRWQLADWVSETKKAAESWLLDRLEDLLAPGGPLADPKPYRLEDVVAAWSRDPRVAAVAGVWTGTGLSVDLTLVAEKLLRSNALPDNPHRLYSAEGLRKLDEWKAVWALQDREDAGEKIDAIPLPPKFEKTDFAKAEFFSTRGKLNVPRERFILFAELSPNRFGWNGWRDRERALAQVEAFALAENDPILPVPPPTSDDPRRCGVTYGLWESLPDVKRWGAAEEHGELLALAREACRQPRCPCPIVEAWKAAVLHGAAAEGEPRKGKKKATEVSLAERAWVVALFPADKDTGAAGVWSRHQSRLAEDPQLTMPGFGAERSPELRSLDEARLALVLDDLVASGDLEVAGRGKKKRFQLVSRPVRV